MKFLKPLSLFIFYISFLLIFGGQKAVAEEETHSQQERRALAEITITADPFGHNLLEHGRPVTVLTKDQVLRKAEPSIGETISKEPGVSSSYFGPGASRPVIRGNAGDRVRVLKNGIGTLDVSNTSEDHAVTSNPLTAESIEIFRGPETLLFGSSAIGGVVNITDNAIPETSIGKPFSGSFDYRQGTADDELSGAAVLEGQAGKFNWHLDYFHQDTNEIDIPGLAESRQLREQEEAEGEEHEEEISDGKLLNSATRSQGFTVGGSSVWKKGFIGISVSGFESKYGVPGHAHAEGGHGHGEEEEHGDEEHEDEEHGDEEHEDEEHEDEHEDEEHGDEEHEDEHGEEEEEGVALDVEQIRVDLRGRFEDVSKLIQALKFNFGYSTYEHEELEGAEVGTKFENDAFEGRIELAHAPIHSLEGVLGFQVQASEFSAIGEEAFLPKTDTFAPAIFLFEELPLNEHWKLQAGARYDFVSYSADGFSDDEFHPWGFSTGFVWDPTGRADYTVGLSFAFTQRAPSATELYADGAHIARQIFEQGDSDLDPEQSYGFDLTLKKNSGVVSGVLNLFVQDYDDYINLDGTGEEEDDLPVFNYETVRALFWGFELETKLHLHELFELWAHDFDLDAQVDFVRAKNRSRSDDLPRIPPLRTIVGMDYKYKNLFGARVEGVFVAKQNDTAEFELETDSYQMLNADLNVDLPVADDYSLSFYVRGTNLNDEEARVHSSFLKDLAPLRGRSVLFGVRGTL